MLSDFLSLLYPRTCINCNDTLISAEKFICTSCKVKLPKTDDSINPQNVLYQKFAYEPRVKAAYSYLYFNQKGVSQKLLHRLKYNGESEIGIILGEWFGLELIDKISPDLILPVPLHKSRMIQRGYNQSEKFAEGIANSLGDIPIKKNLIYRTRKTESQTKKTRVLRWQNITDVYSASSENLAGLSVLIVDDVITTGATIGMLCEKLVEADVKEIHIACMARR